MGRDRHEAEKRGAKKRGRERPEVPDAGAPPRAIPDGALPQTAPVLAAPEPSRGSAVEGGGAGRAPTYDAKLPCSVVDELRVLTGSPATARVVDVLRDAVAQLRIYARVQLVAPPAGAPRP